MGNTCTPIADSCMLMYGKTHHNTAFFIVQLSHPYMTTGKTIALTRQTFVGKVMSLLFIFKNLFSFLKISLFILIGG